MPNKPQSLVFFNQTLGLGGAETFNRDLLAWLKHHGINVTVFTNYRPFASQLIASGLDTNLTPLVIDIIGDWKGLIKGMFLFPIGLYIYWDSVLKHRHADVFLMSGFIEKVLVTPLAKLLNIRVVWIEFAPLSPIFSKFLGLPGFLFRLVSRFPDAVIMPTKFTQNSNLPFFHLPREKLFLIPCAVNVPKPKSITPDRYSVCCVSRLEPGKGQDLLIRAWPGVLKQFPRAHLQIVGEGDFLSELQQLVSKFNLGSSVKFTGRVPDALSEIARCTVFVFPSVWPLEGFGIATAEAMALSKPIVAFDTGPTPELIDSGCAALVSPGDLAELSSAICRFLADKNTARKKGKLARSRYLANFTFDQIGPKYKRILFTP